MAKTEHEFKNILVIHFGQLGDVVLGLPALCAIRDHFPDSRITLMVGKSAAEIAKLACVADEFIVIDRVALRDGNKLKSIGEIFLIVRDVRRRRFDLVIDLNSLYETNLLGFLSGAKMRLYENRENRSLDRLSNFQPRPPLEDKQKHHTDRYLAVLEPLGISGAGRTITIPPGADDLAAIDRYFDGLNLTDKRLIGLFLGAGNASRRWPVTNFALVSDVLSRENETKVLVLLGPEEHQMRGGLAEQFGATAIVVQEMTLTRFYALLSRLDILVTGDTGPMHLASLAGTGIVLLSEVGTTQVYRPLTKRLRAIENRRFAEITPENVIDAVRSLDSS